MRTYIVHYESDIHRGFRSCKYGELTELKRYMKETGKRITEIEYLISGIVVETKKF